MNKLRHFTLSVLSVVCWAMSIVPIGGVQAASSISVSVDDMEAVGPFPSWLNARNLGAVGDGQVDDTDALQHALDSLSTPDAIWAAETTGPLVVYLPAGTYRITRTLNIAGKDGVSFVGEDPANTQIIWDGPAGSPMMVVNGGAMTRFARITWNGNSKAGYGVAHWWNSSAINHYGGGAEHLDEVFMDLGIGIMGGRLGTGYGQGDSEGQIKRVKFVRATKAGLDTGSWNADNWWVWDSQFIDCASGVSNRYTLNDQNPNDVGAGNFMVYRSLFQNSNFADASIINTGWFSMHDNVSIGSRRFLDASEMGANSGIFIVSRSKILDTTDPTSISDGNLGPLMLMDNQIRSAPKTNGPAVSMIDGAAGEIAISIGNSYTVANSLSMRNATDRLLSVQDQIIPRETVSSDVPVPVAVAANYHRQVFEVPPGASAAAIQSAIDAAVSAATGNDSNPIVHLPAGVYHLSQSLQIPANIRIQLVGDSSYGTILLGNCYPAMLQLHGPSRVTVREMRLLNGSYYPSINIDNADQVGGRVYVGGNALTGALSATQLRDSQLEMQSNGSLGDLSLYATERALSVGAGGISSVALSFQSNLLLSDTWYEGAASQWFSADSGNFTFIGGLLAPSDPNHGGTDSAPSITIDGFSGTATFLGFELASPQPSNGIYIGSELPDTHAMFMGVNSFIQNYFQRSSSGGDIGFLYSRDYVAGSGPRNMPDQGSSSNDFVLASLQQFRQLAWDSGARSPVPAGTTDVRLYRLNIIDTGGTTVSISGNNCKSSSDGQWHDEGSIYPMPSYSYKTNRHATVAECPCGGMVPAIATVSGSYQCIGGNENMVNTSRTYTDTGAPHCKPNTCSP